VGSSALSVQGSGWGGPWECKDTRPEQVEASATLHLALDYLQSIDLALNLTAAPSCLDRGGDGSQILSKTVAESDQRANTRLHRGVNPVTHFASVIAEQA
jgi:hypothetical protein